MTYQINPDISEDELIALLCGEYGGIGTGILQDAMNITPTHDMKSDNEGDDSGSEATEPDLLAKTGYPSVLAGQIKPKRWAAKSGCAYEALVKVIDNAIIASELESMNEDIEHGADSKVYRGILLLYCGSRDGQA